LHACDGGGDVGSHKGESSGNGATDTDESKPCQARAVIAALPLKAKDPRDNKQSMDAERSSREPIRIGHRGNGTQEGRSQCRDGEGQYEPSVVVLDEEKGQREQTR
jgi:hypothetical protein